MTYWCGFCKSEFYPGEVFKTKDYELDGCPLCGSVTVEKIPSYETPEQYQKRTGKEWQGAVWFRYKMKHGWCAWYAETSKDPEYASLLQIKVQILCASGPNPPPDDWRPEEL